MFALFLLLVVLTDSRAAHAQFSPNHVSVSLTVEEQAWVDAHPVIRLGIDNAWPPLEFVDEAGNYRGMAAEFLAILEQRLGIRFEIEKQLPWKAVVKAVEAGELDAFSLVVETPQRRGYLKFTRPYLSFPYVIVTLDSAPFVDGPAGLRNRKVAVVSNYAIHDILSRNHPELDLHLVDTVAAGLDAVSVGQAYAFVGNLAVISQVLRDKGITNLKVTGQTPYRSNLAMAFRSELAPAIPIFNKALASIGRVEIDRIHDRWIRIHFERRLDFTTLLMVVGSSLALIVLIFMWVRRLQKEIRQRELAELRMREAVSEAESANQTKSEFLASMSHEIRTPMNGVLGMASNLLASDLTSEQRAQAQTIKDSGDALLALLNDILDLSKIESGHVELERLDFNLAKLLESVDAVWRSQLIAKGLDFSIEISEDLPRVLNSDPTRIRQILLNLVSNAAKFTESGGVAIKVSQHGAAGIGLKVRFSVSDTGIGISPKLVPKLFSTFSQADKSVTRKYGGTGLGLAISKQLAELLGGEIGVDTAPGEGSTFWFAVSCSIGQSDPAGLPDGFARSLTDETGAAMQPRRILVAEDNHINQRVLQIMLEQGGHRVDIVGNGIEALSAVTRARYDLVLMDVQMPEMDGVTATRKIRALPGEAASVPIIAITANAMKGDREQYLKAGMTGYVSKPIDVTALYTAIARCDAPAAPHRAAASDIDDAPVIDDEVLHGFEALVGQDALYDVMDAVAAEFTEFRDAISGEIGIQDHEQIGRCAHGFVSTFGQLGAKRAQHRARALVSAAREDDARHVKKGVPAFLDAGQDALDNLRRQRPRPSGTYTKGCQ